MARIPDEEIERLASRKFPTKIVRALVPENSLCGSGSY